MYLSRYLVGTPSGSLHSNYLCPPPTKDDTEFGCAFSFTFSPTNTRHLLTTATMACSTVQLLSLTIRGSSDAALIVDEVGKILAQNAPSDKLFGTTSQESEPSTSSQNVSSHLVFSAGARSWSEVAISLGDAEQSCNVNILQSDGEKLTGSARLSKLTDGTASTGNQLFVIYVCALDTSRSKIWSDANELRRLKRIQDTVDASFDAMFTIDLKGTILLLNDAAIELFGYDYNELLGEPISKICGGDHAAKHQQYIENYLKTGVTKIMGKKREVPARKKDGTEFPVELGIKEIKTEDDGIIFAGFIKDLSHQKEQERQLRYRERVTQAAVDSSFDPMISINESGIIVSCNKAAINLFGYPRESFVGANISLICGDGHSKHHDEYIQRYLKTGHKKIIGRKRPTKAKRADGTEFDIELGVQEVVDEATGQRLFCGYIRDMTAQKLQKARMMKHESSIQDDFFGPSAASTKVMKTPISRGESNASSTDGKGSGRMPKRLLHHANTTM